MSAPTRRKTALAVLLGLVVSLGLAGCGGQPPAAPSDQALIQAADAGRQALDLHHPGQAVAQYRKAFRLALARDGSGDIGDLGYDLAAAQLAAGTPEAALDSVSRTRLALSARDAPGFAELDLVQAASLHRLGQDDDACALAAQAQADAVDPGTRVQASTLRGLIAARRGDEAGLAAALAALGAPRHPSANWQANHDTLSAHLATLRGDDAAAARWALSAADIQRRQTDYAAMEASLVLAARAQARRGRADAATKLYLRAGTSAASRGDAGQARQWLDQAAMGGASIATQRTAAIERAGLPPSPPVSDASGQPARP